MKYRCDFEDSCDDSSDELDCNDTRFYCQIGYPLYIETTKVKRSVALFFFVCVRMV